MIDENFSHPHVYISGLSHTIPYPQQVEMMGNYIMTHHLTTLLAALNCNDCPATYITTIIVVKFKVLAQHYSASPLEHYKKPS